MVSRTDSDGLTTMTTTYPQKITFGKMCASGIRDVLIYCRNHRCSHHVETLSLIHI